MDDIPLSVIGFSKSYGGVQAVRGASIEVASGSITGLIGPDGAGKTTLMRAVCGLVSPDGGGIAVFGLNPEKEPMRVREMIGYMPQRFSLYPDLSIAENLRFFADLYLVPERERIEREKRLMEFSRLAPFLNRRASQLSGGMKQKLALSCTLIHTPQLLVLDEPTTGVDPVSRKEFWAILRELAASGIALLVSTPYMDEALLCDRIYLMHEGRILASGTPADVASLFPGRLFAAANVDPIRLKDELAARGFNSNQIYRFGAELHISPSTPEQEADLEATVRTIGGELRRIEPEVEDAFVYLLSEGGSAQ